MFSIPTLSVLNLFACWLIINEIDVYYCNKPYMCNWFKTHIVSNINNLFAMVLTIFVVYRIIKFKTT